MTRPAQLPTDGIVYMVTWRAVVEEDRTAYFSPEKLAELLGVDVDTLNRTPTTEISRLGQGVDGLADVEITTKSDEEWVRDRILDVVERVPADTVPPVPDWLTQARAGADRAHAHIGAAVTVHIMARVQIAAYLIRRALPDATAIRVNLANIKWSFGSPLVAVRTGPQQWRPGAEVGDTVRSDVDAELRHALITPEVTDRILTHLGWRRCSVDRLWDLDLPSTP